MEDSSSGYQTSTSNPADERKHELDDEFRASKAIRTHRTLKEKNRTPEEGVLSEEPDRKILRTHWESTGEINKTLLLNRPVINHETKMVDSIDSIEWEETKDDLRKLRAPVIHIDG